jgi:hypothetical protein
MKVCQAQAKPGDFEPTLKCSKVTRLDSSFNISDLEFYADSLGSYFVLKTTFIGFMIGIGASQFL